MKQLIRFAAKLYPPAWRARYGEEFAALLDDTSADARTAADVLKGAIAMQARRWEEGCGAGALVGFAITLAAAAGGLAFVALSNSGRSRAAARVGRASAGGFILYMALVVLVSLLTPRTIVSIGDSYCYDAWCIGVQQVSAIRQGQDVRYKAEVRIFSDANRAPARRERDFLYVVDDQGRRFPLEANARKLYLTGDYAVMPWVPLYFGSDISPLHRRTLLRVL